MKAERDHESTRREELEKALLNETAKKDKLEKRFQHVHTKQVLYKETMENEKKMLKSKSEEVEKELEAERKIRKEAERLLLETETKFLDQMDSKERLNRETLQQIKEELEIMKTEREHENTRREELEKALLKETVKKDELEKRFQHVHTKHTLYKETMENEKEMLRRKLEKVKLELEAERKISKAAETKYNIQLESKEMLQQFKHVHAKQVLYKETMENEKKMLRRKLEEVDKKLEAERKIRKERESLLRETKFRHQMKSKENGAAIIHPTLLRVQRSASQDSPNTSGQLYMWYGGSRSAHATMTEYGAFASWKYKHHFSNFRPKSGKSFTVECLLCLPLTKTLSASKDTTSNLKKHLERKHAAVYKTSQPKRILLDDPSTSSSEVQEERPLKQQKMDTAPHPCSQNKRFPTSSSAFIGQRPSFLGRRCRMKERIVTKDVICLPNNTPSHKGKWKVPRGRERENFAARGLIGKLHIRSGWSADCVRSEISALFQDAFGLRDEMQFTFLQCLPGSRFLTTPLTSHDVPWNGSEVLRLCGQGALYVLSEFILPFDEVVTSDSGAEHSSPVEEISVVGKQMVGRKRRRDLWKHFLYRQVERKTECVVRTNGEKCGYKISGKNTTNLKRHLKAFHHDIEIPETAVPCKKTDKPTTAQDLFATRRYSDSSSEQHAKEKGIAQWVGRTGLPARMVEDEEFITMMAMMDKKFKVPTKLEILNLIEKMYNEEKEKVKQNLAKARRITTGLDIWTTKGHAASFLAVSACYFNPEESKAEHKLLNLKEMVHPHAAESISALVEESMQEWGIPRGKVLTTITGNGSNAVASFRTVT
ncbi:uncharacterized protein LOC114785440 [Denticeps clupeoides]|uniref:uncharacterized protein LOC114785440 n=1 Tax=Denticeps clupeoides TaxID=299321 RepID=UPI0010A41F6F|nr:uncharacterized protein LOC114785440 [Denticeps clupeoides]